ncbi:MAG: SRPBCC domain-containing protein [Candidatus Tectomicrobia bacterium]|nr:SRPBCC domain-containing protein [Candidatus Tectomicrobia bacterium]
MPAPETQAGFTLRLTRTFNAPRERVFRAWTDPEQLKQWWGPKDFDCIEAQSDPRPGGKYRITIRGREKGEVYTAYGEYKEVAPPARLVCTWRWEQWDAAMWETLLTVEFRDLGGATELALTHERFRGESMRGEHGEGWASCLECLAEHLG